MSKQVDAKLSLQQKKHKAAAVVVQMKLCRLFYHILKYHFYPHLHDSLTWY